MILIQTLVTRVRLDYRNTLRDRDERVPLEIQDAIREIGLK
jgi:hypothetical protein